MLNPSLKLYDFLWASITHLFAQHLAYFSSYAEVPEVLSLLASSKAKQGNITRVTRLCRGARGKVASPSSWFMAEQLWVAGRHLPVQYHPEANQQMLTKVISNLTQSRADQEICFKSILFIQVKSAEGALYCTLTADMVLGTSIFC